MSLSRVALLCLCNPSRIVDAHQCPGGLVCDLQDDDYRCYDRPPSLFCQCAANILHLSMYTSLYSVATAFFTHDDSGGSAALVCRCIAIPACLYRVIGCFELPSMQRVGCTVMNKYYICACRIVDFRLHPQPPTSLFSSQTGHHKQQRCNRSSFTFALLRYRRLSSCLAQSQLKPRSPQFCRRLTHWPFGTRISQVVLFSTFLVDIR